MDGPAPWPDLLAQGRAAFNRGQFFEAHELWEDAWRTLAGGERLAVQGLIQVAAGLHHLQQGRRRPAFRLLTKGVDKLSRGALPAAAGLRVDALTREVARLLERLGEADLATPDIATLKL